MVRRRDAGWGAPPPDRARLTRAAPPPRPPPFRSTLGLALLTTAALLRLATEYGWMLAATYAATIVVINFVSPWIFKARLRTHKNVIRGPWDVAQLQR